ncbi:MAG: FeS assembly protein SufB [candidate division TM6 bacterium GW2011_GWF2_30_66]|jgi:Fe-S cluster assembly protein SufB|nr:MAG: FeS assembly protein SufB [candidate division TM6 bacterium GW2011_GWF2_30_66]
MVKKKMPKKNFQDQKNKKNISESHEKITHEKISKKLICQISEQKNEPGWLTDFRLNSLDIFESLPMPKFGPNLEDLDTNDICFYLKPTDTQKKTWQDVPEKIKRTFDVIGVPHAEKEFLAGVGAQYDSEIIYKSLREKWVDQGVVFLDISDGLKSHKEIFKKYFGSVVPANDNKFAALNSAVFSGGSLIIVPKGVHIDMPLQAYFRVDASKFGQFERTLIIAEQDSSLHYVEGCSAPVYKSNSLHCAVVEVVALENAKMRYTTIQNWSENIYNLVTKRAVAHKNATVEWVDGNFGSKVTMKYPSIILKESGAKAQIISIAVAKKDQVIDSGAKCIHLAENTSSSILSKSISKDGGVSSFRGLIKVEAGIKNIKSKMQCNAIILDNISRSDAYPKIIVKSKDNVDIGHEASVSKLDSQQLFYLMSRGFSEQKARSMIVNGFIDVFVKELPMEYAVEINRLINADMEGKLD